MDRLPTFFAADDAVCWSPDGCRSVRLQERQVDALLDLLMEEREPDLFNLLHDAHTAAGGIERASPFRKAA